jgi:hypothetical protein
MQHVEPEPGPAAHELVGVDLGASCVGIVEVAPRQHVHTADPEPAEVVDVPTQIGIGRSSIGLDHDVTLGGDDPHRAVPGESA